MRNAIRNKLLDEVSKFNNVYQPTMVTADTNKPFALVSMGAEAQSNISMGFNLPVNISVYVKRLDYNNLDSLVEKTIKALNKTPLTEDGKEFSLKYIGTIGNDGYDEEWDALYQTLEFQTQNIRK